MSLGWYPGHMHKARKQIKEALPQIDVIIEVLDARLPYSSANPMIAQLRGDKPCLKLLSKSDLADPELTRLWLAHYNAQADTRALAINTTESGSTRPIAAQCRRLVQRNTQDRPVRVMVMGIPNVGKSTLINSLAGKRIAKVGDEPAVTKRQQKVILKSGMAINDTPGILWPKIEDQNSAYRLAASGAIRDTAMDYEDVGLFAARELLQRYPALLCQRYKLATPPDSPELLLDQLGRKRGCLRAGGIVDRHKAAEILLNELRAGQLGRITLETPADIPTAELLDPQSDAEAQDAPVDNTR